MIVQNEEKRSTIWRSTLLITTIVIIAVAVYIIVKLFTTNPLIGTWYSDDGVMKLVITDKKAEVVLIDDEVNAAYTYTLDRTDKFVAFEKKDDANKDQASLQAMDASFAYSIDQDILTLTEREYGEQLIFVKQ